MIPAIVLAFLIVGFVIACTIALHLTHAAPKASAAPHHPGLKELIAMIRPEIQAQLDRIDQDIAAVDAFVQSEVAKAVAAVQQDHDDEVAALTAKIDALTAKLTPAA